MKRREPGASPENEAPQDGRTGFVGDVSAVSVADCNITVSEGPPGSACRHCGFLGPHQQGPGAGPHAARLVCGACIEAAINPAKPCPFLTIRAVPAHVCDQHLYIDNACPECCLPVDGCLCGQEEAAPG